jgi:hypothetical protein
MRCRVSHVGVTDRTFTKRKGFTTHRIHLNSQSKKRLVRVVSERGVTGVACMSGIHISMLEPSLFYFKSKTQKF